MAVKKVTALVQGQTVELTYNESTGYYEGLGKANKASSFPEEGGYFPVEFTVEDTAGNSASVDSTHSTFGSNLRLFTYEEKKPIITILSPTANAYITDTTKPEIRFSIVDKTTEQPSGYSGINKASVVLKINGQAVSGVEFTNTEGGYIGTYTPSADLADGEITISVDGKDNDGNSADTASVTFKIDNLAPSLTLTSPADGLETNKSVITVSGTTNDTSKPVTVNIKLNGADQGEVTVNEDGSFSKDIDLSKQGENVIEVSATDASGKSTTITRTIIFSTTAPVFTEVGIIYEGAQVSADNKVPAGGVYTIRCKVTTS